MNELEQLKEHHSQQFKDLAEEKQALVTQLKAQTEVHLNET